MWMHKHTSFGLHLRHFVLGNDHILAQEALAKAMDKREQKNVKRRKVGVTLNPNPKANSNKKLKPGQNAGETDWYPLHRKAFADLFADEVDYVWSPPDPLNMPFPYSENPHFVALEPREIDIVMYWNIKHPVSEYIPWEIVIDLLCT